MPHAARTLALFDGEMTRRAAHYIYGSLIGLDASDRAFRRVLKARKICYSDFALYQFNDAATSYARRVVRMAVMMAVGHLSGGVISRAQHALIYHREIDIFAIGYELCPLDLAAVKLTWAGHAYGSAKAHRRHIFMRRAPICASRIRAYAGRDSTKKKCPPGCRQMPQNAPF